jgi:hypothetical protein
MKLGRNYNAYKVLEELDLLLKEAALSGYEVRDMRAAHWSYTAIFVITLPIGSLGAYLSPHGDHSLVWLRRPPGIQSRRYSFSSTEELEDAIRELIRECG